MFGSLVCRRDVPFIHVFNEIPFKRVMHSSHVCFESDWSLCRVAIQRIQITKARRAFNGSVFADIYNNRTAIVNHFHKYRNCLVPTLHRKSDFRSHRRIWHYFDSWLIFIGVHLSQLLLAADGLNLLQFLFHFSFTFSRCTVFFSCALQQRFSRKKQKHSLKWMRKNCSVWRRLFFSSSCFDINVILFDLSACSSSVY